MRLWHTTFRPLIPGLFVCSDGVVRPSIPAFRADDSGSNPGRSTPIKV